MHTLKTLATGQDGTQGAPGPSLDSARSAFAIAPNRSPHRLAGESNTPASRGRPEAAGTGGSSWVERREHAEVDSGGKLVGRCGHEGSG